MTINNLGRRSILLVGVLAALLAGAIALMTASSASAQGLPAICDEYPDLPQCQVEPTPPPNPNPNPNDDPPSADDGDGGDGDGRLPFTGYPLTGLILLFLALLAVGLAIRGSIAVRERLARGPADL